MKYTGEGSMDDPKFPLRFVHTSGAQTICHNRADLTECIKRESRQVRYGVIATVIAAAIFVPLIMWGIAP